MPWAKLDDDFFNHPKVAEVGTLGAGLFALSLSYSAHYLSDGFIPTPIIHRLIPDVDDPLALAESLVSAGLFEKAEKGYLIHDYLDCNPSAAEVKARREERAEAGRNGGLAKARNYQANIKQDGEQSPSKSLANGLAVARQNPSKEDSERLAKVYPIPIPNPIPDTKTSLSEGVPSERDAVPASTSLPLEKATLLPPEAVPVPPNGGEMCLKLKNTRSRASPRLSEATRVKKDKVAELTGHFASVTRLNIPPNLKERVLLWENPLKEIVGLCQDDVGQGRLLIAASLKQMADLTVSSPRSIINVARSLAAKGPPYNGNGNGHNGNGHKWAGKVIPANLPQSELYQKKAALDTDLALGLLTVPEYDAAWLALTGEKIWRPENEMEGGKDETQ